MTVATTRPPVRPALRPMTRPRILLVGGSSEIGLAITESIIETANPGPAAVVLVGRPGPGLAAGGGPAPRRATSSPS